MAKPVCLIVGDEPFLLMHAVDVVTDAGLEALGAANAAQASFF